MVSEEIVQICTSKMKKALSNLARPDAAKDIVSKIYEEI